MGDRLGEDGAALSGLGEVGCDPESAGEIVSMSGARDEDQPGPLGVEKMGEGGPDSGGSAGEKSFRARDAHKDQ